MRQESKGVKSNVKSGGRRGEAVIKDLKWSFGNCDCQTILNIRDYRSFIYKQGASGIAVPEAPKLGS